MAAPRKVLGQRIAIAEWFVHPDHAFPANDIVLLHLASDVPVAPIVLNRDAGFPAETPLAEATDDDANSVALGWGRTSEGGSLSDDLRRVDLPVITLASCMAAYGNSIGAGDICAGYPDGGRDACQGDSGGPLAADGIGGTYLVGIVSGGIGCARPNLPGYYERVSFQVDWIAEHVPDATIRSPTALTIAVL